MKKLMYTHGNFWKSMIVLHMMNIGCTLLYKCFVESFRQKENEHWGKSENKDLT